jgi:transcriptional regulator with XRE-family HTH domain
MNTADRIKQLLLLRGVNERDIARDLARLCGITKQGVGAWFLGTTKKISPDYLAKIAMRYQTTMEWLVTGKGNMDATAAATGADLQLDELIGQLYTRQGEFNAEQFAALRLLLDGLEKRATSRFEKFLQGVDKQ